MNVLEKILKEIEERKKAYHMYSKRGGYDSYA